MINGERDAICPKQSSEMMYRYLSEFYLECSEQLKLSILDIGHEVTLEMEERCCNWFKRYL
jgi:predicted esterase